MRPTLRIEGEERMFVAPARRRFRDDLFRPRLAAGADKDQVVEIRAGVQRAKHRVVFVNHEKECGTFLQIRRGHRRMETFRARPLTGILSRDNPETRITLTAHGGPVGKGVARGGDHRTSVDRQRQGGPQAFHHLFGLPIAAVAPRILDLMGAGVLEGEMGRTCLVQEKRMMVSDRAGRRIKVFLHRRGDPSIGSRTNSVFEADSGLVVSQPQAEVGTILSVEPQADVSAVIRRHFRARQRLHGPGRIRIAFSVVELIRGGFYDRGCFKGIEGQPRVPVSIECEGDDAAQRSDLQREHAVSLRPCTGQDLPFPRLPRPSTAVVKPSGQRARRFNDGQVLRAVRGDLIVDFLVAVME